MREQLGGGHADDAGDFVRGGTGVTLQGEDARFCRLGIADQPFARRREGVAAAVAAEQPLLERPLQGVDPPETGEALTRRCRPAPLGCASGQPRGSSDRRAILEDADLVGQRVHLDDALPGGVGTL
jgi:hypothetical protein